MKTILGTLFIFFVTLQLAAQPMEGIYTVGGRGSHYSTLTDAIANLNFYGASGDLTFKIEYGTHEETNAFISKMQIPNWNDDYSITIIGDTINQANVVLEMGYEDGAIQVNNIVNFTMQGLTLKGPTGRSKVHSVLDYMNLGSKAGNIHISNCTFQAGTISAFNFLAASGFSRLTITNTTTSCMGHSYISGSKVAQSIDLCNLSSQNPLIITGFNRTNLLTITNHEAPGLQVNVDSLINCSIAESVFSGQTVHIVADSLLHNLSIYNNRFTVNSNIPILSLESKKCKDITIERNAYQSNFDGDVVDFTISAKIAEDVNISRNGFTSRKPGFYFESDTLIGNINFNNNNITQESRVNPRLHACYFDTKMASPTSQLNVMHNTFELYPQSNGQLIDALVIIGESSSICRGNSFNSSGSGSTLGLQVDNANPRDEYLNTIIIDSNSFNNTIAGIYYRGYFDTLLIKQNRATSFTDYAITAVTYGNTVSIMNNECYTNTGEKGYGIGVILQAETPPILANNVIMGTLQDGIQMVSTNSPYIHHNTISVDNSTETASAFKFENTFDIDFRNNIVNLNAPQGSFHTYDTISFSGLSNNYYCSQTGFRHFAAIPNKSLITYFEDWQKSDDFGDANSMLVTGDAPFSSSFYISCDKELPVSATTSDIKYDIDGDLRQGKIFVGADQIEYFTYPQTPKSYNTCFDNQVVLSIETVPQGLYQWNTGSTSTNIYAGTSGTYTAKSYSSCSIRTYSFDVTIDPLPIANFSYTFENSQAEFENKSQFATSYAWLSGQTEFSTATNPNHIFNTDESHVVTLIATNSCGSDTASKDVSQTSGIFNHSVAETLHLYPNIANDHVYIKLPTQGRFRIQIVSSNGTIMHTTELHSEEPIPVEINTSSLPSGLYIVKATYLKNWNSIFSAYFVKR